MSLVVVRLRGVAGRSPDHRMTLELLRLFKVNHATIVPANDSYRGMLKKVEHFVTYGDLTKETAVKLLRERGRAPGNKPLTDTYVREETPYGSLAELAEALAGDQVDIGHLDAIKPVFRLNPARGGLEGRGKKHHVSAGGALGYRGKDINAFIERML
ncbi:MAG: 50S ribosomal protein L30 [bacterium]